MRARTLFALAAGLALASGAGAAGSGAPGASQPAPDRPEDRSWTQRNAEKARELGQRGTDSVRRGASAAGKKVNEGGQAATARVVGTKTVTGRVAGVSRDHVTVKQGDGTRLDLRVTDATKVTVGGKQGSAGALRQGDEVRASYAQSGGSATATRIEVTPPSARAKAGKAGRGADPSPRTAPPASPSTPAR